VTLPKLEEMNDDQLVSMFGLAEGSQENLAGKIKTFLAGLNNEEAEEANSGDPNFEEMTDDDLESWLANKGDKFADRLRLFYGPKTGADHEPAGLNNKEAEEANTRDPNFEEMTHDDLESWLASKGDKFADRLRLFYGPKTGADHEPDPFQSEFSTPPKFTKTPETRKSTKKEKEKARRQLDDSHKSSGDEDPVAPKATKKRKTKSGEKKSGAAKPKASEEGDSRDHDTDASDEEPLKQKKPRRQSPDRQAKNRK
jgi:hypothetical protein